MLPKAIDLFILACVQESEWMDTWLIEEKQQQQKTSHWMSVKKKLRL